MHFTTVYYKRMVSLVRLLLWFISCDSFCFHFPFFYEDFFFYFMYYHNFKMYCSHLLLLVLLPQFLTIVSTAINTNWIIYYHYCHYYFYSCLPLLLLLLPLLLTLVLLPLPSLPWLLVLSGTTTRPPTVAAPLTSSVTMRAFIKLHTPACNLYADFM